MYFFFLLLLWNYICYVRRFGSLIYYKLQFHPLNKKGHIKFIIAFFVYLKGVRKFISWNSVSCTWRARDTVRYTSYSHALFTWCTLRQINIIIAMVSLFHLEIINFTFCCVISEEIIKLEAWTVSELVPKPLASKPKFRCLLLLMKLVCDKPVECLK